jgi:hypothetical protein
MAVSIPRSLVEHILLGPTGDRRQLQDSPVLGDVWIAFAKDPGNPQELLITPHNAWTAGAVAIELDDLITKERMSEPKKKDNPEIAYLQVSSRRASISTKFYRLSYRPPSGG